MYRCTEKDQESGSWKKSWWGEICTVHLLAIFHSKDEGESQRRDSPLRCDLERTMRCFILRLDFFLNAVFLFLGWGIVALASSSLSELSDQAIVGKESLSGVESVSNSWYNELESKKTSTHTGFEENISSW